MRSSVLRCVRACRAVPSCSQELKPTNGATAILRTLNVGASKSNRGSWSTPVAVALASAVAGVSTMCAADEKSEEKLLREPVRSVVLYQYNTCPYCNKVRAYLDAARIPYIVVEVNPLTKGELSFSRDYRKVPVAIINGRQVNDSGSIIDTLEIMLENNARRVSDSFYAVPLKQKTAREEFWRKWVDDKLVHTLSPNLYRTPKEAWDSFDYLTQRNFPVWSAFPTKVVGSIAMYFVGKRLKSKHGITDERQAMVDALNEFVAAIPSNQQFIGGTTPDLADVALFGVLRAIEGCPTWNDAMEKSSIKPWYQHMTKRVGPSMLQHRISESPAIEKV